MTALCGSTHPGHRVRNCRTCIRIHKARTRHSICHECGAPIPSAERRSRKYCNNSCKARAFRRPHVARVTGEFRRTPLNEQVDALYAACNGSHVPSGAEVYRDLGHEQRMLPVCARCGVPITGRVQGWNRKIGVKEAAA